MLRPRPETATLRRRDVLVGAAGLALLTVTASACGSSEPKVDPLQAVQDQAVADAEQARAAAAASPPPAPPLVRALNQIAGERTEHARALGVEIARAAGQSAPTATTTTATTAATGTGATPPPTVKDVVAALRRAADGAGQLAATQAGYRAGLLGSIAASCTASATVTLNAPVAAQ